MVGSIWTSRRFWMLILDMITSLSLYFVGKYAGVAIEDLRVVIAVLQPIFVTIIISYTVEDNAAIKAGVHPRYLPK